MVFNVILMLNVYLLDLILYNVYADLAIVETARYVLEK